MPRCSLTLVLIGCFHLVFSQTKNSAALKSLYASNHSKSAEKIFLHLNKSTFIGGEDIWFTAYLYDSKTGLPSYSTTNLYCGLYNSEGIPLTKTLFYASDGVAHGSFELKPEYGNTIYIKAHAYTKELSEDFSYVQQIKILGAPIVNEYYHDPMEYDIQLLPEGGHLLSEAKNTIAFKILDLNGKGMAIEEGMVITADGKPVLSNIVSNDYGMGKFHFDYQRNSQYTFVVKVDNGQTLTKIIPPAEEKGIVFSANTLFEDKLVVELHTNTSTLPELYGKNYHLAMHRDGQMIINSFTFTKVIKTFHFKKEGLLPGINFLTLFDEELNPIAERLLFNTKGLKIGEIATSLQTKGKTKDSVSVQVDLALQEPYRTSLSVSILPEESFADTSAHSIIPELLLKPYIKHKVENAPYYFQNTTRKKSAELDNLLLTQGWTSYNWADLFQPSFEEDTPRVNGIKLKGMVKNSTKNKNKIFLLDESTNNQYVADINSDHTFSIPNAIVFKNSPLQALLFDHKGRPFLPEIELTAFPNIEKDTLDNTKFKNWFTIPEMSTDVNSGFGIYTSNKPIILDNVVVSARAKPKYVVTGNGATQLNLTDEKGTVSNFVRKLGFRTFYDVESGMIYAFHVRGSEQMPVFVSVNGFGGYGFYDNTIMYSDRVYYSKADRWIVFTPKNQNLKTKANYLLKEGFEKPLAYYRPKYTFNDSQYFLNYGAVHWEPRMEIAKGESVTVKFPSLGLKRVKLYIEGMSDDGTLFSSVKTISLP